VGNCCANTTPSDQVINASEKSMVFIYSSLKLAA
jgi:hypothetical protein